MPLKSCFISIRTQIAGITLLLLIAWLTVQSVRLYDELAENKALKQRQLSEETLIALTQEYIQHIAKELHALPESAWLPSNSKDAAWLSQYNLLSIERKTSGSNEAVNPPQSNMINSEPLQILPFLSCANRCVLSLSIFKYQNGEVNEWLLHGSLDPLLAQLAEKGIIAVIQPQRLSERLESTLLTFSQRISTKIPDLNNQVTRHSTDKQPEPALPILTDNSLSYQGIRYQMWEHPLTWPSHRLLNSSDTSLWVTYFTQEPSITFSEWLGAMGHSWNLIFPLLLLLLAVASDTFWGKRIRSLHTLLHVEQLKSSYFYGKNWRLYDELSIFKNAISTLLDSLNEKEQALDNQSRELRQQTLFDPLTGLYNRQCFMFELNRVIANQQRQTALLGLILLDINEFKRINSVIGLQQADLLLQQLAQRMRHMLRESDLLCRLNGDLFAILTSDIQQKENIHILMNKLFSQLQQPLQLDESQHRLQFSAGIVIIQKCFSGASELLAQAEIALQEAKSLGHNRYQLFTTSLLEKSVRHCFIAKQFPHALLNGQLSLHFQPIYDLSKASIVGLEAFTRWHHPQEGYITPCEFIPVLEESQLSEQWGDWVLEQALAQLYQLDKIGQSNLQMTVNLTTRQLFSSSLLQVLERLILAYHIRPNRVIIELNEAPLIHDYKQAHAIMASLHDAGYLLSLDNFGSGYSALGYLHRLPFDYIKLASSFTIKMIDSDIDRQLVSSILQMGHAQGKKIVGERVDNALQSNLLQELGCDQLQGYLISHPLSECDLASQLAALTNKFSKQSHARHQP